MGLWKRFLLLYIGIVGVFLVSVAGLMTGFSGRSTVFYTGIVLLGVVAVILLQVMSARAVIDPITAIVASIKEISGGEYDTGIDDSLTNRSDEIGELAASLKQMTTSFKLVVSRRKEAEQELALREAILDAAQAGILVVDTDGDIVTYNDRFQEMWRIPDSVMEDKEDVEVMEYALRQLEDPDAFERKVQELYGSNKESFDEVVFKDGRIFERYSRPHVVDGENVGRVWSFLDVTEERQQRRRLDAVFNQSSLFKGLLESDGTLIAANDTAMQAVDADRDEVIGKKFWDTPWWKGDDPSVRERLKEAVEEAAKGNSVRYDSKVYTRDGEIWFDCTLDPVLDDDGNVTMLVPEGLIITDHEKQDG